MSIFDFFVPSMRSGDGGVNMFLCEDKSLDRLYILNNFGKKLLQLRVKNEKASSQGDNFAQIKIIPYGIRKALIWEDKQTDPKNVTFYFSKQYELTYHGPGSNGQNPKIHLVEIDDNNRSYKTLLEFILPLSDEINRLVPIFSLDVGHAFDSKNTDSVKKKGHIHKITERQPTRLDFYLSSSKVGFEEFFQTHYSLSLFFSLDYLSKKQNGVLRQHLIAMPIIGYTMKEYRIWVRCTLSENNGRPALQFFNNANYYNMFMDRPIAWRGQDGVMEWSTIKDEDAKR